MLITATVKMMIFRNCEFLISYPLALCRIGDLIDCTNSLLSSQMKVPYKIWLLTYEDPVENTYNKGYYDDKEGASNHFPDKLISQTKRKRRYIRRLEKIKNCRIFKNKSLKKFFNV